MSNLNEKEVEGDLDNSNMDSSVVVISEDDVSQSDWTFTSTLSSPGKRKRTVYMVDLESEDNDSDLGDETIHSLSSESSKLIAEEKGSRDRGKTATEKGDAVSSDEDEGTEDDLETSWADIRDKKIEGVVHQLEDCEIDNNLPETVSLLRTPWGSKVYVVGTAHFSHESQEDVARVIKAVQPNYVVVELCRSRSHMLMWDEAQILEEAKSINYQMIRDVMRTNGVVHGAMYLMLLSVSAHITRELGMAPGGEFRRAWREAKEVPHCVIHLGDRPIHVTLRRALASLSWWQSIKLAFHLLTNKEPIKKEDVERCKKRDILEEMIAEMAGEYPELKNVFVNERDLYLTYSLQNASMMEEGPKGQLPCKVVGVVGIGHVPGITARWNNLDYSEIPAILTVPPPSRVSRALRFTVKASLLGLVLYTLHKVIPNSVRPSCTTITGGIRNASSTLIDYLNIKK